MKKITVFYIFLYFYFTYFTLNFYFKINKNIKDENVFHQVTKKLS